MSEHQPPSSAETPLPPEDSPSPGPAAWWRGMPLYLRILVACLCGAAIGVFLRELRPVLEKTNPTVGGSYLDPLVWAQWLAIPSRVIVRHLLTALAAPLVLVAVVQALM